MTTSGITEWSMTARDVIRTALEDNRIIPLGEEPEAAELTACIVRLNGMLKSWQAKGVTMWREDDVDVEFTAGDATVTLAAGVSNVLGARLVVSSTHDRPMTPYTRDDYSEIPNKSQAGQPIAYTVAQGPSGTTMTVWPVPTTTTTIRIDAGRSTETVTDADETLDIPEMWQETVYSNLALRVAGLFGAQLNDELVSRARMLETQMLDYDRPDSYNLGPLDDRYRA